MIGTSEIVVFIVSGVAAILAVIVCILILILCHIVRVRRKRRKHQISTSLPCHNQGTALTTLTTTVSSNDKHCISAFAAPGSRRDASSIVKSDTSTTSSNHIRVSDGSASSGNSTKAEIVMTTPPVVEPPNRTVEATNPLSDCKITEDSMSADYAEIEEEDDDKTEYDQRGDTLQSAADSTLSTVSSFNSGGMRDSTLLYDGGQNSFLDNLEPGAHNTPKFPRKVIGDLESEYDHLAVNKDYEKDPSYVPDHDYEQDPDYEQQKKNFDPPLPPAHLYQALQQQAGNNAQYKVPERTLRPVSEKLPAVLEQPDYADAIPHCHSLSTRQPQNYNYTQLRASTLDPLPHYTHLDINTKENIRGSGLSYITTDL